MLDKTPFSLGKFTSVIKNSENPFLRHTLLYTRNEDYRNIVDGMKEIDEELEKKTPYSKVK